MLDVLEKLSEKPLIFKGGSALMFFYELDRFSEDLDFDCDYRVSIQSLEKKLEKVGKITVKKNTDTVKRLTVVPHGEDFTLKIEISLRGYEPIFPPIRVADSLSVYNINDLFRQKIKALKGRKAAKDLYDIGFIVSRYYDQLSFELKRLLFSFWHSREAVYDLIPLYIDLFSSDTILTDSDLLKTATRLMEFHEKMEKEMEML